MALVRTHVAREKDPDADCTDRKGTVLTRYVLVRIPGRRVTAGERNKMKLERIEEMIDPQDMYLCRPHADP
ncbi:uncharacterized protein N7525_004372 [Penicillium rubens]|uniref:uncharacterized protein n=1 Tax=Penicillium rubens TaxID=1108849 RepID=UPI002A5A5578|nr:uncharacterized protein N7525_004372 [Penicillium rubens]KAJ5839184.1 hypothetical protein N7525_004372 [Penicillium rubens]KAJ5867237.1 hypothetical protein N7534_001790 [Penicillium rubens]